MNNPSPSFTFPVPPHAAPADTQPLVPGWSEQRKGHLSQVSHAPLLDFLSVAGVHLVSHCLPVYETT